MPIPAAVLTRAGQAPLCALLLITTAVAQPTAAPGAGHPLGATTTPEFSGRRFGPAVADTALRHAACRCGDPHCSCDLAQQPDVDGLLSGLGYDSCAEDGGCEACTAQELALAYCLQTGRRQRLLCARCRGLEPPPPFCLPGNRIFWSRNGSSPASNASLPGPAAGLFLRSCGHAAAVAVAAGNSSTALLLLRGARRPPDEASAVLTFLSLTALGLLLSACSLRRQQQAMRHETMAALYGPVSNGAGEEEKGGGGSSGAPTPSPRSPLPPGTSGRARLGQSRSQGPAPEPGKRESTLQVPPSDKIGRSLEKTLADAVARTGSALELAVRQGSAGSEEKMK